MWLLVAQKDIEHDAKFPSMKENLGVQRVDGIMSCNGRLAHANISKEAKVPILLSGEHRLRRLLMQASHT